MKFQDVLTENQQIELGNPNLQPTNIFGGKKTN